MNGREIFFLTVLLVTAGCKRNVESTTSVPSGISCLSLLAEASDFSTLAQSMNPAIKAKMFSSAADPNKVMLANLAPEVIGDIDYGFFTKIDTNKDGVNATLAEFNGPGVVTWVWSANPVGILKLYIDGQDQPALSMPFVNFIEGRFLPVREPFGTVTSLGYNLNFPIIHAKYCKLVITVPRLIDLAQLYYQVSWQSLPPDAVINPFDIASIQSEAGTIKKIGERLLAISKSNEPLSSPANPKRIECLVEPGQTIEIFRGKGAQAIDDIRFTAKTKTDLNGLRIEANWDGEAAIRSPLHMLAGVSPAMEDTESLPATINGTSLSLRWFMPFAKEGQILCVNSTDHPCRFTVEVWTRPIDATRYPLRFHANFSKYEKLHPDAGNCLTFVDTRGPGRFVGCVLGVDSRSDKWWGEGDNIVWLDDTNSPAMHGTGTEDYFGFAWCSPAIFNHPFRGQTSVVKVQYHWTSNMHRYHFLDQLPYQKWGRFQFVALGLGNGEMDWTTTMMWYEAQTHP